MEVEFAIQSMLFVLECSQKLIEDVYAILNVIWYILLRLFKIALRCLKSQNMKCRQSTLTIASEMQRLY